MVKIRQYTQRKTLQGKPRGGTFAGREKAGAPINLATAFTIGHCISKKSAYHALTGEVIAEHLGQSVSLFQR